MINNLPVYMATSLFFTLLIECLTAVIIKIRNKNDILIVALVNILTNPIVVCSTFLAGFFLGSSVRMAVVIVLEIAAFLTEALIYSKTLSRRKINPFIISLVLNAMSYLMGFVINRIIY